MATGAQPDRETATSAWARTHASNPVGLQARTTPTSDHTEITTSELSGG